MTEVSKLATKFKQSVGARSSKRARRSLGDDAAAAATGLMELVLAGHKQFKPLELLKNEQMAEPLHPAAFAIVEGFVSSGSEANHLPALRGHHLGTREVVLVNGSQLWDRLTKIQGSKEPPSLEKLYEWLRDASYDDLASFSAGGNKVHYCTVGPNDLLYTPGAFIFADRMKACDVVGFRIVPLGVAHLPALAAFNQRLLTAKLECETLLKVVDRLTIVQSGS